MFNKLKNINFEYTLECIEYIKNNIQKMMVQENEGIIYINKAGVKQYGDNLIIKSNNTRFKISPVGNRSVYDILFVENVSDDMYVNYKLETSPYIPILEIHLSYKNDVAYKKNIFHSLTSIKDGDYDTKSQSIIYEFFKYIDDLYTKNII